MRRTVKPNTSTYSNEKNKKSWKFVAIKIRFKTIDLITSLTQHNWNLAVLLITSLRIHMSNVCEILI